jgi:hypothetical protein
MTFYTKSEKFFFKLGLSRSEGGTPKTSGGFDNRSIISRPSNLSGAHHEAKKMVSNTVIQLNVNA